MIKAVFFDFAGVLLDQDTKNVLARYDYDMCWRPGTSDARWHAYLALAHLKRDRHLKSENDKVARQIKERLYRTNRVMFGMRQVLEDLRRTCKLAVISNFPSDLDNVVEHLDLLAFFDVIVNSSLVRMTKPDKRIYRLACRRLKVRPRESVFIDDSAKNVIGAEHAGMAGIVFTSAERLRHELKDLGVKLS